MSEISRRAFTFAPAVAMAPAASPAPPPPKFAPLTPGIKISMQVNEDVSDEDLSWIKQMGVEYLNVQTGKGRATYENFVAIKTRMESHGLKVWNISNNDNRNIEEITLGLPGRDQKIEWLKQYIRDTAKAGIGYITYAHMANGIWSSERETTRGGAPARAFRLATAKGYWNGKVYEGPLTHGRRYSKEELWDNYTYFIRQIAPVAEEVGVRIGIHPDDPPVPELGGIPRHIFGTFDGYVKALEIANSPAIGVCLCCGTWMEGGKHMGKDVFEAVRAFAKMGKLWKIHFRNVSSPVPNFVETFVDNGYTDMYKLMKTLVEVDFRGNLIADHVPAMAGGRHSGWSYSMGYIRALYHAAQAELKRG
ncbi:MAG: mannonate dehydratase [Bryobacteraceae bacterium]|nr:mannonate dehydratase [Bryobacteraceae bacterium]MDW8379116.1 mannonate dehydratase [Bryobacterales bacterium]